MIDRRRESKFIIFNYASYSFSLDLLFLKTGFLTIKLDFSMHRKIRLK